MRCIAQKSLHSLLLILAFLFLAVTSGTMPGGAALYACDPADYEKCRNACFAKWDPIINVDRQKVELANLQIASILANLQQLVVMANAEIAQSEATQHAIQVALGVAIGACIARFTGGGPNQLDLLSCIGLATAVAATATSAEQARFEAAMARLEAQKIALLGQLEAAKQSLIIALQQLANDQSALIECLSHCVPCPGE